ncbi:3-deoxy-D-manno-octulosonic acid transferase [Paracoccus sediminicola]|uniref:3-deoxy-D-manno-octulosonic acid transferase n=1 Tax=Paracoccus sediminicola TaxID=3017783 RepID=UPI0022F02535|nr:glycosyltransferase N-terminal domain-containing protein [Paracoccus sediminicola]WBU56459.1 3-deoxy-D-manno-octulosonic acid transferase [Paracoccus sediminicola]
MRMRAGGVSSGWWHSLIGRKSPAPVPPPDLTLPSGDGPLIWMRIGGDHVPAAGGSDTLPATLIQLLAQLRRRGLQVAVSRANAPPPIISTRGVSAIPDGARTEPIAEAHLAVLNPAAILFIGAETPQPLIDTALRRGVPLIQAEARMASARRSGFLSRAGRHGDLSGFAQLLLPDSASKNAAIERGARPERAEITGPITLTREPLRHNEAERESLAEAFHGRQLWLAACVNEDEEAAVIEAHLNVLRYSHRALLILLPADPRRADGMAMRAKAAGLAVAERSLDDDPTEEVNVYLSDDYFEMGLWYRLAPLCFLGTTLAGPTEPARDPFEAALLGSAAIHGPQAGSHAEEWAQLDSAGAAYRINDAAELTQAVLTLLAPDQAAQIATHAWGVATGGAGAASRIAQAVRDIVISPEPAP